MTARKKIIIHIGHGKTGSSAIQSALARNHDLLKSAGILYPETEDLDPARRGEISSGNLDPENWFGGQVIPAARQESAYDRILFSSENIFLKFDAFLDHFQDYGAEFEFEIILFVREPFEKLNSSYQQAVKRRGFAGNIQAFADHDTDTQRAADILAALKAAGIAVRVFNYSTLRRASVQAFFEHLGVWDLVRAGDHAEVGIVNRSLTAAELRFMVHVNQVFGVEFGSVIADALVNRLPDLASGIVPIDPETQRRFHDRNADAVRAINDFLPAFEQLRLSPPPTPPENDEADQQLSSQQIEIIRSVFPATLIYRDGIVLRDIAMKYESGEPLTRDDAIALMQFAQKARPHGQIIAGKLKEWRGDSSGCTVVD